MSKYWTTRDGTKIKYTDMTDSHLINCIRMIRRQYEELRSSAWSTACSVQGEMASYYIDQDIAELENVGPYLFAGYDKLMIEADRRGLEIGRCT